MCYLDFEDFYRRPNDDQYRSKHVALKKKINKKYRVVWSSACL